MIAYGFGFVKESGDLPAPAAVFRETWAPVVCCADDLHEWYRLVSDVYISESDRETAARAPARGTLVMILLARFVLNTQFRIVYPFLPAISRGLGVSLETASLLLTARALAMSMSPLLGLLSDRSGRRRLMLLGLGALVAGCLLLVITPGFGLALIAFGLMGVSKAGYDPAVQAYASDTVPYAQRGRILGVLELSWSLAWLLGVPAAGLLIAAFGWRSPFLVIGVLGAVFLAATARTRVWDSGRTRASQDGGDGTVTLQGPVTGGTVFARTRRAVQGLRASGLLRAAVGVALLVNFLQVFANENVFIVYGAWMENQFGLSVAALGLVSGVIAVAELLAEVTSAGIVDRLGKRRSVFVGLVASVLAYLLLPQIGFTLTGALIGVSLLFVTFEFSIVSTLPLVSELAPGARATILALNISAMGLGRAAASLAGPRLWQSGGVPLNAAVSASAAGLAAIILLIGIRKR